MTLSSTKHKLYISVIQNTHQSPHQNHSLVNFEHLTPTPVCLLGMEDIETMFTIYIIYL